MLGCSGSRSLQAEHSQRKTKNKSTPPTKNIPKQTNKNEICIVNSSETSVLGLFTRSIKIAAVGSTHFHSFSVICQLFWVLKLSI